MYTPPITLTQRIIKYCVNISRILGYSEGINSPEPKPELRRENQIKTIQSTLAIEGNQFSLDQVTAIIEGKRVLGKEKEILEVHNTISVYKRIGDWKPTRINAMLKAHKLLMNQLIDRPGSWRTGNVGIIKGKKISHVAPSASRVPGLMIDLFEYLKKEKETDLLIKACIFHYEFLFIHPFIDGNGRMARLWQQLILMSQNEIFRHVSIESLIKENQKEYYQVLERSDKMGESTVFVEFMLRLILLELDKLLSSLRRKKTTSSDRIKQAHDVFKSNSFSRKDYLKLFSEISTATASRDLKKAVEEAYLIKKGSKATTVYRFQ